MKWVEKMNKYFAKHTDFNGVVHSMAGIAVGILLTNVFFNPHPVRWAAFFALLAILGHWYAYKHGK